MLAFTLLLACSKEQNFHTTSPEAVGGGDSGYSEEPDADGDGFIESQDCDDTDGTIHPDATEVCDGIDNDCDEAIDDLDDDVDLSTTTYWYDDLDLDGYGDPESIVEACSPPAEGMITTPGDCDDANAEVHPEALEVCNDLDDDCDLLIDDEDDDVDPASQTAWYADLDGDGFGDPTNWALGCAELDGHVADDSDCDDATKAINPEALEVCNELDDDCDGLTDDEDDSVDLETGAWYFEDSDGDGYGNEAIATQACAKPDGYKANKKDCDDTDAEVNPDAVDVCDGVDNDCDSATSEDGTASVGGVSYSKVQVAIAAATSGDTVMVCDGTFTETLETSVDLTLESLNGAGSTTLSGGTSGAVITAGGALSLSGFTIEGGTGPVGGGIDAWTNDAGDLDVTDCILTDNSATYGGGLIGPVSYDTNVTDTEFKFNDVTNSGGAIYMSDGSLSGVDIHDNEAQFGAGVFIEQGATVDFDSSTDIYDNDAEYAGGVFLYGATLDAGDATIRDNDADQGGGVLMTDIANSLSNATISGNTADYGAGLLSEEYNGNSISEVDFSDNVGAYGGALYVYGGSMDIDNSTLDNNSGTYGAGILLIQDGDLTLDTCTLTDNTASTNGGGILIYAGDLTSSSTDWGSGSSDNSPEDIYAWVTAEENDGNSGSFTCDETGC